MPASTLSPDALAILRKRINTELTRCLKVIELKFGRRFPRPLVTFDLTGLRAGSARPRTWQIQLNPLFFETHADETVHETVPHEFAHLIDYALHPENFRRPVVKKGRKAARRSLHGPTWKQIMRALGVAPERCHQMTVPGMRRRIPKRYDYRCPYCGNTVVIGPRHHKALQQGTGRALLKDCGHIITGEDCLGLSTSSRQALEARNNP